MLLSSSYILVLCLLLSLALKLDVVAQDSSSVLGVPDIESYNVENDFVKHLSKGWFPQPYSGYSIEFSNNFNYLEWDNLSSIRSAGFSPTKTAFSSKNPFKDKEDEVKKKFSPDNAGDDFPSLGYDSYGLSYSRNLPWLSSVLRLGVSYDVSRTRLYALDTTRSFLSETGVPQRFNEVTTLFVNQHFVNLNASVIIPLYGVFLESEALNTSSFYFVAFGAQALTTVLDEATQFTQIANAKDQLRYANGTDTVTTIEKLPLSTTNTVRGYAECSIGWRVSFRSAAMITLESYALIPLTNVLNDAQWNQYRFGFRLSIGVEQE